MARSLKIPRNRYSLDDSLLFDHIVEKRSPVMVNFLVDDFKLRFKIQSMKELHLAVDVFDCLDSNHDGMITLEEFKNGFPSASEEIKIRLFNVLDKKSDRSLDFKEFCYGLFDFLQSHKTDESNQEVVQGFFALFGLIPSASTDEVIPSRRVSFSDFKQEAPKKADLLEDIPEPLKKLLAKKLAEE